MTYFAYIDQKIVPAQEARIKAADLGLLRGFGIFDYFRLHEGCPLYMDEYLSRFVASAKSLHMPEAPDFESVKDAVLKLLSHNQHDTVGIRLLLTGDTSDDFYLPESSRLIIFTEPFKAPPPEAYKEGITVKLLEFERFSARIKTTSYLPSIAAMLAPGHTAQDILYHKDDYISELSRSNFFAVKEKVVYTPNDHVLMGITRRHVISLAREQGFDVVEAPVRLADIPDFEECFMTSTTKRVVPITVIDQYKIADGKPGPMTKTLLESLLTYEQEYIHNNTVKREQF